MRYMLFTRSLLWTGHGDDRVTQGDLSNTAPRPQKPCSRKPRLCTAVMSAGEPFPQALAPNPYPIGDTHAAYEHCRRLECLEYWNTPDDLRNSLSVDVMQGIAPRVAARVLGHGIILAPNDVGRDALVRDILACEEDFKLLAGLAHLYVYGLIRMCT